MARLPQASLPRRRCRAGVRQDEHEEGRREPGWLQQARGTAPSSPLHRPATSPGRAPHPMSIFPGAAGRDREGHKLGGLGWDDWAGRTGVATLGAQRAAVPADVPQPCPMAAAAVPLPSLAMTQPGARPPPGTGRQPRTRRAGAGVMDALVTFLLCGEGWMRPKLGVKVAASHRCLSPSPQLPPRLKHQRGATACRDCPGTRQHLALPRACREGVPIHLCAPAPALCPRQTGEHPLVPRPVGGGHCVLVTHPPAALTQLVRWFPAIAANGSHLRNGSAGTARTAGRERVAPRSPGTHTRGTGSTQHPSPLGSRHCAEPGRTSPTHPWWPMWPPPHAGQGAPAGASPGLCPGEPRGHGPGHRGRGAAAPLGAGGAGRERCGGSTAGRRRPSPTLLGKQHVPAGSWTSFPPQTDRSRPP